MNVFDWIVLAILVASLFYGYKVGLVDGVVTVIAHLRVPAHQAVSSPAAC